MTHILSQFETFHGGPLHAVSFDLYGTKVATASSDESIRLWDVSAANAGAQFLQELRGHSGPVWQVCWAHPRFGSVLGSCGYDRRIVVWQQQSGAQAFVPVYSNDEHGASVNALAFAPEAAGLILAAGSSDGCISVLTHQEGDLQQWSRQVFSAHFNGVLAVAWAPIGAPGASGGNSRMESLLMASGGGVSLVLFLSVFVYSVGFPLTRVCAFAAMDRTASNGRRGSLGLGEGYRLSTTGSLFLCVAGSSPSGIVQRGQDC
ncbi:putative sec 13 [Cyclospora cayetanensis]|uniref:Sec 13 n=1 Tax=Cyclospora cayetanensis TaxID=88456 RepID=A0A1D3CRJ6_9EIME|nr:putative sec 13 [Cyclospora cayetanensis]